MCAADTTLEGQSDKGEGWGGRHTCKNYDEIQKWAEELTPWTFEDINQTKDIIDVVGNGHL